MNIRSLFRMAALASATLIAPLALSACAADGNTSGGSSSGGTDAGASSSSSSSGGSSSGSDAGSSSSSGGSSSSGSDAASSGGSSSGGAGSWVDAVKEIQKAQGDYKSCSKPKAYKKGITVSNLTVVSKPFYIKSKSTEGIYTQAKGGGEFSGVYVVGKEAEVKKLKVGDVITVTGDAEAYYCAAQMNLFKGVMHKESGTALPSATTVTTDKIGEKASNADNQKYENALVELQNVVVSEVDVAADKKDFGHIYVGKDENDKAIVLSQQAFWMPDTALGKFDSKASPKWSYAVKKGDKLKVVRGILAFNFNRWRVFPVSVVK